MSNPYESPKYDLPPVQPGVPEGAWRHGKILVARKGAQLPPRCVKTNEPATAWITKKFSWHHPILILLICAGLLFYVIFAIVLTKSGKLTIGLTDERLQRRRILIGLTWVTALGSLTGLFAGVASIEADGFFAVLMLTFMVLALFSVVFGVFSRVLTPVKITDDYIYLRGAHPDFLKQLPPWPYD